MNSDSNEDEDNVDVDEYVKRNSDECYINIT